MAPLGANKTILVYKIFGLSFHNEDLTMVL